MRLTAFIGADDPWHHTPPYPAIVHRALPVAVIVDPVEVIRGRAGAPT